jgi:hypothetical protein
MTFSGRQSESQQPPGNSPSAPAGLSPLFKQENESPANPSSAHVSLNDYISRHLNPAENHTAEPAQIEPIPEAKVAEKPTGFHIFEKAVKPEPLPGLSAGQRLNSLDVELTAGLEQYLPTPVFRLRVMKKRLDDEIADLRQKMNKYERLPEQSPDMRERVKAIRTRIRILEAHEAQVSHDLAAILHLGPTLHWMARSPQQIENWLNHLTLLFQQFCSRLFYGDAYIQMETAGIQLRNLQELFAERLKDPKLAEGELSQLLTRYEQELGHFENAKLELSHGSFGQRLWQQAQRLLK